ncbi:MAG: response regulator [Anaerolineae bacterium]|nr:response regulator [Anaerolineae bacterium]
MNETKTREANILVVDDHDTTSRFLMHMLTRKGYHVLTFSDGPQALIAAQANPPDLILLDIMMPQMTGYEVCEHLKADARTRDVPVIFLSAMSEVLDKVKAFEIGGVDYITKPFQVPEVMARIETQLMLRQYQKELKAKNAQLEQAIYQHQQTEETLRRYAERLKIRHEIDQSILAARSPETIAVAAVNRLRQLIPCQRVSVMAFTTEGQVKLLAAESSGQVALKIDVGIYQCLLQERALQSGHLQGIQDLTHLPHRSSVQQVLYEEGVLSYVIAPLHIQGELVGTLNLEADHPDVFTAEHITIVIEVAALLAMAIRQARLYELAQQEIADRKQAEAALRQQAIELETRNAELDTFAHTVAHDLKNPVAALIGFGSLLESRYGQMAPERLARVLSNITQIGRKMTSIIDELLLLASVRKMEDIQLEALDIGHILTETHARLEPMIEEYNASLIIPDAWPSVLGYAPWVEEVWVNYISNAIKYGGQPESGITPKVELGYNHCSLMLGASEEGLSYVRFWVRDNGAGLTSEEQAKLFTQFQRLAPTRIEGHGLGLSIVQRIVTKLGGKVGVESKKGEGSMFWFTLPQPGASPIIHT